VVFEKLQLGRRRIGRKEMTSRQRSSGKRPKGNTESLMALPRKRGAPGATPDAAFTRQRPRFLMAVWKRSAAPSSSTGQTLHPAQSNTQR